MWKGLQTSKPYRFGEWQQLSVQREHTDSTQIHVKNTSVGIITMYLIRYLSSLISLKGIGSIHYSEEHCTTVLVKCFPTCPS